MILHALFSHSPGLLCLTEPIAISLTLVFQHIHNILYRKDLSWRYMFKKMNGNSLKKEFLDSLGFIQFCELE